MQDRTAALEKQVADLQSQIYDCQVKHNALRAVITYVAPGLLEESGFISKDLHDFKDVSVAAVLNSTVGGVSPKLSDDVTQALSDEIEALYNNLADGVERCRTAKLSVAKQPSPLNSSDPIIEALVASGIELPDSQLALVAFIIRNELTAAIDTEFRGLLTLCEREARWTVDHPTAKLILQRIESFAKARMNTPPASFFDAFRQPSSE